MLLHLPDDMLIDCISFLGPVSLAALCMVSKSVRDRVEDERVYRQALAIMFRPLVTVKAGAGLAAKTQYCVFRNALHQHFNCDPHQHFCDPRSIRRFAMRTLETCSPDMSGLKKFDNFFSSSLLYTIEDASGSICRLNEKPETHRCMHTPINTRRQKLSHSNKKTVHFTL
jgi:hypothetical protein